MAGTAEAAYYDSQKKNCFKIVNNKDTIIGSKGSIAIGIVLKANAAVRLGLIEIGMGMWEQMVE